MIEENYWQTMEKWLRSAKEKIPLQSIIEETCFMSISVVGEKLYSNHPKNMNDVHKDSKDLVFNSLCCRLCIYYFILFPVFPFFLSDPWFLRQNPWFMCQNKMLPWFLRAVVRVVRDRGGSLGWRGDILGLVRFLNWSCSLTCQSDSQLRILVRLLSQ